MTDFIAIYENALTPEFCQACIEKFESSSHQRAGRTGFGVDQSKKVSTDITLNSHSEEWQQEIIGLQQVVLQHLLDYVRQYPYLLAGAIALQHQRPSGERSDLTAEDIMAMPDADLRRIVMHVYRLGTINIQKYDQGKGGYFHWHSEHYPHPQDPTNTSLHRVLLWMFYLNDVDEGGETEFYFQNLKSKPSQGTMVIAPASFTHTHRGSMPVSEDKYIFTSWVLYQSAQALYGQI